MKTLVKVFVGSGGVGKTTLAAAFGVLAAQKGMKTLVLTIDPSQRLAQVLGIQGKTEIAEVSGYQGNLWASVVHHKAIFDQFVYKSTPHREQAERLLNNKLYQQLSTHLSGSQEFTSLEMLLSQVEKNEYDLVILDTPPASHAMDFLNAPQKLTELFNKNLISWFRSQKETPPGFFRNILNFGTHQFLKILEQLTGSDFVRSLFDFFENIDSWQKTLEERTKKYHELLTHPETQFYLVTGFEESKLIEAKDFAKEIRKNGYSLNTVILNRAFPDWSFQGSLKDCPPQMESELSRLAHELNFFYQRRLEQLQQFEKNLSDDIQIIKIPDFFRPLLEKKDLASIGEYMKGSLS